MNKLWRQLAIATNWPILVAVAVLCALGIVSIWAHSALDPKDAGDVKKQVIFLCIGVGVMLLIQAFNYLHIGRFSWGFYLLSLGLLVYTILPGVPRTGFLSVPDVKNQTNWINFGPLNLQPAELAKISFCMVLARYLRYRSNYRTFVGLIPPFLLAVLPLMLILKQPDLGWGRRWCSFPHCSR
jgi:rod shape determining protein RodA